MLTQEQPDTGRAPTPPTEKAAPAAPASSAAFQDSPLDARPAQAAPLSFLELPVSPISTHNVNISLPVVGSDSPDAQPRVETHALMNSLPETDVQMDFHHVHMESQPQEEACVTDVAPVTPPSTQEQDTHMATPPSVTPPPTENRVDGASSDGVSGPPTPATTAPLSERAPSPLDKFLRLSRSAIADHYKRATIFGQTREIMFCRTRRMCLTASRGFQRGNVPTKRTTPPLLKRRYSIDVSTSDWNGWWASGRNQEELEARARRNFCSLSKRYTHNLQRECQKVKAYHLDPIYFPGSFVDVPNPSRYVAFGPLFALRPPFNTDIYLELGDATIRNDAFCYIGVTDTRDHGSEVWMRDESIDMALEVLRRDSNCDAHSIAIANSMTAQVCYFACQSKDGSTREYDEYRTRFQNKKWIFIVINDAIGGLVNDGTNGTHWSLVAMDCEGRLAHYYDSMYIDSRYHQHMGLDVCSGMLYILGENPGDWKYQPEWHSPHQNRNNQFYGDGGACGPFVFKMTELLVDHIRHYQRAGNEDQCYLQLDRGFPAVFENQFHSQNVRRGIQMRIARWKAGIDAPELAHAHDQNAIRDEDVALIDEPIVTITVPPHPVLPIRREASRRSRYSTHHSRTFSRYQTQKQVRSQKHSVIDLEDNDTVIGNSSYRNISNNETERAADIRLSTQDPYVNLDIRMDIDADQDDDQDGGISLVDRDLFTDEPMSGGHPRITNTPEHSDDEDASVAVSRIA
ncbi:hypothetical protein EJ02DRAFT_75709 [Clathrospora elynae]|uniref:Ubiquitin-like protease family profile domain-containing protein n=1 Tax=Clathrospora elynae TaxID=706981 RepID=A0A6A5S4Z2_9PLEO|nr:hypothetical protein EJ02DRAFT_516577 [Clathrospora elynae]KAF1936753.1 hypothetical protein EJ02DRAFT_75709 [Clathrospora elynae]